jgi:hypothetical protein
MKLLIRRIIMAGAVIGVVAQAFRPERSNPASDPSLSIRRDPLMTPDVLELMDRSCFDCHTNETRWPWYTNLTPVNFLVARDVARGRQRVNLSNWLSYAPGRRASLLEQMVDEVSDSSMPLAPYRLMHPEASWSDEEKKTFLDWAAATQDSLMAGME